MTRFTKIKSFVGSGGIRTHASEETGALNQRLRPLGHATLLHLPLWEILQFLHIHVKTVQTGSSHQCFSHLLCRSSCDHFVLFTVATRLTGKSNLCYTNLHLLMTQSHMNTRKQVSVSILFVQICNYWSQQFRQKRLSKVNIYKKGQHNPSKHCCTGPVLVQYIRLYRAYMASLYWSSNILHPGSVVALYGLPAMDLYRIVLGQYRTCRQPWYGLYTLFLYWASTINWYWTSTGPF